MWIESAVLQDFRNYTQQRVEFSPHLNLILGDNGEGKTNLLEALFLLSTTRSHRTNQDRDLVRFGEQFYYVGCKVNKHSHTERIEVGYSLARKQKIAKLSGVPLARLSELIGVLNVVLFSPEDLDLVKGSPGGRRRFLDIFLSQLRSGYVAQLQRFNKVLGQRNDCLRLIQNRRFTEDVLCPWDEQYADLAVSISGMRRRMMEEFAPEFHNYARKISGREKLTIDYDEALSGMDESSLIRRLEATRAGDIQRGSTSLGPHRDDLTFLIDGRSAALYASQGQQRTAVLALKLAELGYLQRATGECPVLLLDDVFSELDEVRKEALVKVISGEVQSFVTGTRDTDLDLMTVKEQGIKRFVVEKGRVT